MMLMPQLLFFLPSHSFSLQVAKCHRNMQIFSVAMMNLTAQLGKLHQKTGIEHATAVDVLCEIHPKLIPVVPAVISRKGCVSRHQKKVSAEDNCQAKFLGEV